ncbi:hypothetical protein [Bernardetia sp.]|uniref:hypothetical protein n=1 Tax=Bernardetia sp. TaxID=1937974 RepID=UPI0025BFA670|nr:hypothetical protein [Bernardetia sp.]
MLNESELSILLQNKSVREPLDTLRSSFFSTYTEIRPLDEKDFFALTLLAPSIAIALANGSISLFEELSLTKKARMLSRQENAFRTNDPLLAALKQLIKDFGRWENGFYEAIKTAMYSSLQQNELLWQHLHEEKSVSQNWKNDALNAPYVLVKFLVLLFLEEEKITTTPLLSQVEYKKLLEIGEKLELTKFPIFKSFCSVFDVR